MVVSLKTGTADIFDWECLFTNLWKWIPSRLVGKRLKNDTLYHN